LKKLNLVLASFLTFELRHGEMAPVLSLGFLESDDNASFPELKRATSQNRLTVRNLESVSARLRKTIGN
jgi:hypothetical protein